MRHEINSCLIIYQSKELGMFQLQGMIIFICMKQFDKIIQLLDRVFWAMVVVWAISDALGSGLVILLSLGLTGIAVVFFIEAYRPLELEDTGEESGFSDLLGLTIVPKILGIASSVATVGIMFYQLGMPGYPVMLGVGLSSILICLLILAILRAIGIQQLEKLRPRLIKSTIVTGAALFLFMEFL